jgi:hypothetical protein
MYCTKKNLATLLQNLRLSAYRLTSNYPKRVDHLDDPAAAGLRVQHGVRRLGAGLEAEVVAGDDVAHRVLHGVLLLLPLLRQLSFALHLLLLGHLLLLSLELLLLLEEQLLLLVLLLGGQFLLAALILLLLPEELLLVLVGDLLLLLLLIVS